MMITVEQLRQTAWEHGVSVESGETGNLKFVRLMKGDQQIAFARGLTLDRAADRVAAVLANRLTPEQHANAIFEAVAEELAS